MSALALPPGQRPRLHGHLGIGKPPTTSISKEVPAIYEGLTDANMALFSFEKIALPQARAPTEPTKSAPTEQIERRRSALSDDGRKDDACTIGKSGWNLAKYSLIHKFCRNYQLQSSQSTPSTERHTKKSADGSALSWGLDTRRSERCTR